MVYIQKLKVMQRKEKFFRMFVPGLLLEYVKGFGGNLVSWITHRKCKRKCIYLVKTLCFLYILIQQGRYNRAWFFRHTQFLQQVTATKTTNESSEKVWVFFFFSFLSNDFDSVFSSQIVLPSWGPFSTCKKLEQNIIQINVS